MKRLPKSTLRKLIKEAIVDAHDDAEQLVGFFTMLHDNVAYPFHVTLLGAPAVVVDVEHSMRPDLVFVCARGRERLRVGVLDLPTPRPAPDGWEWVESYRLWAR